MEIVRTVGDFELIFEPLMSMFRIVEKESSLLSLWFNAITAEELLAMGDDEFIITAEDYLDQAQYSE